MTGGKRENLEYYKKLQLTRGDHAYEYEEKQYPRGLTMADKKVVDSRYASSLPRITRKHVLLFISYIIVLLIYSNIYRKNRSYTTLVCFLIVLFLLSIPVFYLMQKKYYGFLMYIIVITIFGTMGYGWGLLGILTSLNPLKPNPNPNPKINSNPNPNPKINSNPNPNPKINSKPMK